jgi:hypothetical protein
MLNVNATRTPAQDRDLQQLIEPLSQYISATDRPHVALQFAVVSLVRGLRQTSSLASSHVKSLQRRYAQSA